MQAVFDAEELGNLAALADPSNFTGPLDIPKDRQQTALSLFRQITLIRKTEELIGVWAENKTAKTPCHLAIGQEAVAAGVSAHLRSNDRVFSAHRSHAHFLALNPDPEPLLSEILGKACGASKGMGGSMHLSDPGSGFIGSVPIVAGTIPIAAGAALAAKMDGGDSIAVCYMGDGASEEGVFHETLNLASQMALPVLFVCENNLYSSHLDIKLRQPCDKISRFATAAGIRAKCLDGNDVFAVYDCAAELIREVRLSRAPAFLEAVTYRLRGHVGPDENTDVGLRRSSADLEAWKKRDPLKRLKAGLLLCGVSEEEIRSSEDSVEKEIARASEKAILAPYPEAHALLDLVYAGGRS